MSGNAVREMVGFVGVIASLVFVGSEIRQNNRLAKAAAYQAIGVAAAAAWDTQAHDRDFTILELKEAADMDTVDWVQWRDQFTVWARLGETTQLQVADGVLPEDAMTRLGFAGWSEIFNPSAPYFPKVACVWPQIRSMVSESFRSFVEEGHDLTAIDCGQYALPSGWPAS